MRIYLILLLALTACATRRTVPEIYSDQVEDAAISSRRTVVYFLIDGLGVSSLKAALTDGQVPSLRRHFMGRGQSFHMAHSVFPSLTYPNISSLLAEKPVHETGALGNSMISKGRVIRFESVLDRPFFSQEMRRGSIFTRLKSQGKGSVSLDYGLGVDATVASDILDLEAGLALQMQNYRYLDEKHLDSLRILLSENPPESWPEFIFIHLIGFDFLSHQKGPRSQEALGYLHVLDQKLDEVFSVLEKSETSDHKTISILSADHGFRPEVTERFPIEESVKKLDPRLEVLNEGRMAALFYPRNPTAEQLKNWSRSLLRDHTIEIVAYRSGDQVRILSRTREHGFQYKMGDLCAHSSLAIAVDAGPAVCPHRMPSQLRDLFYPYFIENLASYFQAEKHPDLVVIPIPTAAFLENEVGFHGGPTPEETFIPLLIRNATLTKSNRVPAIWELLQFM